MRAVMFVAVWRFRVRAGQERAFEIAYNSNGHWAQLFGRATGHRVAELLRGANAGEYLTIDRWENTAAFDAFKRDFGAEYARLDEACAAMTEDE